MVVEAQLRFGWRYLNIQGKRWWKIAVVSLLVLVLIPLCGGCWSRREIQDLAFVTALGVDKGPEEGTLKLTVHIAKPFAIAGGEGRKEAEKPFLVASSTGSTALEATRNFVKKTPGRLDWTHNRFVLFGESFAKEGIIDTLSMLGRDTQMRRSTLVIVAYNSTAEELLQAEFELERIPASGAEAILTASQQRLATSVVCTVNDFMQALQTEGIQPIGTRAQVVPLAPAREEPGETHIEGELQRKEVDLTAEIAGIAVFNGDRLVGFMEDRETRGYNWISGQVQNTIMSLDLPQLDKKAAVEVIRAKSSIIPQIESGSVTFKVKIDVQAIIQETSWVPGSLAGENVISIIEQQASALIKEEAESALAKAQELNADVFGFGREIYRRHPREWAGIKEQWEELFPLLNVQFEVTIKLKNPGMTRF